ncbi:MAG: YlzJ-like family protein [Clostridia bacterium]|nr:YlzJ-like family protein [Clostridia bacterium]
MILYTAMPLELVLEGLEDLRAESGQRISLNKIEVQLNRNNKIERVFSTNPQDYLKLGKYLREGVYEP